MWHSDLYHSESKNSSGLSLNSNPPLSTKTTKGVVAWSYFTLQEGGMNQGDG